MHEMDHLPLFGEILQEMGLLTSDQVSQILEDQAQSGQKFGQVAVRMGWLTSEQVLEAWARQMSYRRRYVDPQDVGIDTQAVERVTIPVARAMKVVPLRLWGDNLVVASAPDARPEMVRELAEATGCKIYACMAFPESIQYHLDRLEEVVHTGEAASSSVPAFG